MAIGDKIVIPTAVDISNTTAELVASADAKNTAQTTAQYIASGSINAKKDDLVFNTAVGNEYKLADTGRFKNIDGNVIEFPSGTTVNLANHIPEVQVLDQATDGLVVQSSVNAGGYVVVDGTEVNDIYRATEDIPALTSLTDSRFEDRTQIGITNQVATTTLSDGTIYSEVFFNDCYATETVNDMWTKNGWSKLSHGLYSKGVMIGSPMGIWQTLNKGAYHPDYNAFGCDQFINTTTDYPAYRKLWYQTADITEATSTYGCYDPLWVGTDRGTIGSTYSGRPDSKYYDIIYEDQWIDCRIEANKANPVELLNDATTKAVSGGLDGVSGVVFTEQVLQVTTGTVFTLEVSNGLYYSAGQVLQIYDMTNGVVIGRRVIESVSGNTATLTESIIKTAVPFLIGGGQLPILSSGSHLATDIIGSCQLYPEAMKSRLSAGLPLIGLNPHLIDDEDNSLIPDGVAVPYKAKASKKLIEYHTELYTVDGTTWVIAGNDTDTLLNLLETSLNIRPAMEVRFYYYTAKNPTTLQCDPMEVKTVGTYAVGSNSHLVTEANMLIDGKIGTSNLDNKIESRLIENVILDESGTIVTVPSNNNISLNASDSSAYKHIPVIFADNDGMAHFGLFSQEMISNGTAYDGDDNEFSQLTNGTTTDDLARTITTKVSSIPLNTYLGDE